MFERPILNGQCTDSTPSVSYIGSLYISGKLPTYPSPKPTFCPKRKVGVDVDVGIGEG